MRGGGWEGGCLREGAMNGWSQSERGVDLSRGTQVRLNGSSWSEEGWGHGGHSTGGTGTEESWAAEDSGRDWYGTLWENKFCSISTDSIGHSMLRRQALSGWGCGTAVAH